jgi:hypothetical protein
LAYSCTSGDGIGQTEAFPSAKILQWQENSVGACGVRHVQSRTTDIQRQGRDLVQYSLMDYRVVAQRNMA